MPRPVRPWFRFYVEALADRKIRRLKPTQRWVWIAVLGAARESHEPGSLYIAPGLPMTVRELAGYADVSERDVASALAAMESMAMIARQDDLIVVTNWNARQFESDDVTKRTRDHRERSQERSNDVPGNTPETETEKETEKEVVEAAPRLDVARLCEHLADRIEGNGSKRPTIGKGWRDAARLMLDSDNRTEEQIHKAIDWCQDSEFWRPNVMSMSKLREKFDVLRLQAVKDQQQASKPDPDAWMRRSL